MKHFDAVAVAPDVILPEEIQSMTAARRKQVCTDVWRERQDAAMITVLIGLKCLNQVFGMGLNSLAALPEKWGPAINDFYKAGKDRHERCLESGYCGDLVTDPLTKYADLSDRKRRKIAEFLSVSRLEAQGNAYQIGLEVLHDAVGIGAVRRERLERQWLKDLSDFYECRELNEPLLISWIEEIGFAIENGRLRCYRRRDNDKPVRKRTAEKMMEE